MKLGQDNIIKVYAGTSEVSKIYLGSDLVFSMDSKYVPPEWDDWEYKMDGTWNTSKYNTISCDGAYTGNGQYPNMIWDGSGSGYHTNTASHPHWIGFFTVPIKVNSFSFWTGYAPTYVPHYFEWQGSNDGQNWVTLGSYERESSNTDWITYYVPEANKDYYQYHRLYITQGWGYYEFIGGFQLDADVPPSQGWVNWTQPILTSDNSYGIVSASSVSPYGNSNPYTALDGNAASRGWATNGVSTGWWKWQLPHQIKITAMTYVGNGTGENKPNDTICYGRFYTSDAMTTPIGDAISQPNAADWVHINITGIPEEGIITDCIYFDKTAGSGEYAGIGELIITAQSQLLIPWLQPALTSDTSYGTITSSVTTWGDSPAWKISDGVIGRTKWGAIAPNGASVTWALPDSIKMQSCKVYQTNETPVLDRFPTSINIYGSNNNSSWDNIGSLTVNSIPSSEDYVTVNCSTNNFYSYYRWDFGASTNANGEMAVSEIVIDAVQQP